MKIRCVFLIVTLLVIGRSTYAQQGEIYDVITSLKQKINFKFRISDSLCPIVINDLHNLQRSLFLSKKEVNEIRKKSRNNRGLKLDSTILNGASFVSGDSIYKAYQVPDSSSLAFIERNKPFYTLSLPILFDKGEKAIINLDLIGRGGYTYLLVKRNDKWIIEKEIVRWIV